MAQNIITIDGPGGSGKSTITRLVAARLGLGYLDTGAMYRAATLHCMEAGVKLDDPAAIAVALASLTLDVELVPDGPVKVRIGGRDVTALIRTPEVTRNIRFVADHPAVRARMIEIQRRIARAGNLVTEGRDQGTDVFPHAGLKVYLVASPMVRARRRQAELEARGVKTTFEEVMHDVQERDKADMNRPVGALRKASDAVEIDTSDMSPAEVAEKIVTLARGRLALATRRIDKSRLRLEP